MARISRSIRTLAAVILVACCAIAGNPASVWAQGDGSASEQKLVNPNSAGVEMLAKIPGWMKR